MASQQPQPQPRPWFRLASLAGRPPPQQPTAVPESQANQPRPRPPFRPLGQTQTLDGTGVSSVPTSPVRRTSVPTSPVQRTNSPPRPQITAPPAPTASLQTSPVRRPLFPTVSVRTSPVRSTAQPTVSVRTSPVRPAPYIGSVTTSPVRVAPPVRETSPPKPAPFTAPVEYKPAPSTFSVPTSPAIRHRESVSPKHPQKVPTPVPSPPRQQHQTHQVPPLSPLSLPPPQLHSRTEHEPKYPTEKGVLVERTIEKPRSWPVSGPEPRKEFEGRPHHKKSITKSPDHDEITGMRMITLAGENRGAFMEVIKSPAKPNNKSGYATKPESDRSGWKSSSSSDEEGKSKKKDKGKFGNSMLSSPQLGAFMNSNVQGVNNSLVFNSSCSHHDPGVHLSFSRTPSTHGFQVTDDAHHHDLH